MGFGNRFRLRGSSLFFAVVGFGSGFGSRFLIEVSGFGVGSGFVSGFGSDSCFDFGFRLRARAMVEVSVAGFGFGFRVCGSVPGRQELSNMF